MAYRDPHVLAALRQSLAGVRTDSGPPDPAGVFSLGAADVDQRLGGGLARAALHEIHAPTGGDLASAAGFALALALRAAEARPLCWVRQDFVDTESGELYPPGLAEFGIDPARLLLVRAQDGAGVLRAGAEAVRCSALGAVLMTLWGEPRQLDLTATRRLSLRAEASGVTVLLLRVAAAPAATSAHSRWQVRAGPSRALAANAPGRPVFEVALLRQRGAAAGGEWSLEWNHDHTCFRSARDLVADRAATLAVAPLSGAVVPAAADRSRAAEGAGVRRLAR